MRQHLSKEQMDTLALGLAGAAESARALQHLETCAGCRREFQVRRALADELAAAPLPEPDALQWEAMTHRALDRARRPRAAHVNEPHPMPGEWWSHARWVFRLAVLSVVFGCGYWVRGLQQSPAGAVIALPETLMNTGDAPPSAAGPQPGAFRPDTSRVALHATVGTTVGRLVVMTDDRMM
jgi:hypothetical protein